LQSPGWPPLPDRWRKGRGVLVLRAGIPKGENASGLDADLEFVGRLDAECAADFKERGRVEVGQPLFFLDHLVAP
jgi:hypothetical protein